MSEDGILLRIEGSVFKGDLKQIFGSVVEAAAKTIFAAKTSGVVSAGVPNAISAFFGALKNIKWEDTNEYRAWQLVSGGLLYAVERTLAEVPLQTVPSPGAINSLARDLANRVENRTYTIEPNFFDAPDSLGLLIDFADLLGRWLRPFGGVESADGLRARLTRHFSSGLHRTWMKNAERFAPLEQALRSPFGPTLRQRQEYDGYLQYLEDQFAGVKLIGQDEDDPDAVTLANVFVPLRAYFEISESDGEILAAGDRGLSSPNDPRNKPSKAVVRLFENIESWISAANRRDAIRIISGGPGIGKSSSMRAFASRVAQKATAYPLLIPLQN